MRKIYRFLSFFALSVGLFLHLGAQTYCIPLVSAPLQDDEIRYVSFGTMSNLTSCTVIAPGPGSILGGYSNFTGSLGSPNLAGSVAAPTCAAGSSYTLTVGLTMCNAFAYYGIFGAYIDYNHNGSFTDLGEYVWNSSYMPGQVSPAYNLALGIITIPCTAQPGLTRLRVWESEVSVVGGPCSSITWGEVEDYLINIVAPTSPITVIPTNPTVCPGGTVVLNASGGTNYNWSGGISNGVPFSPTATAIYTVSAGTGSCAPTQTVLVTYNPPLTVAGPSTNICAGSSATLIANGGTTYSWSTGATTPSITVSPPVTTTYTLFGSSNTGCNTQGTYTVNVEDSPTVTAVSNPTNGVCPNSPLILTGTGATAYSWSGGVINGVAFTPTGPATYTVTGTNVCGSATAAISVSINPLPNVSASINNPTVCSGNPVILTGGGAATYVWTGNAGNVPNNVQFSPSATTNYTIKGTSVLGCTATAVTGVTVLNSPTLTPIATPSSICFGATSLLSSTGATGYTWTPGGLNTPNISVTPFASTTYTLFRTNGPCASTATLNVIVNPVPIVSASASSNTICQGAAATLSASGALSYLWQPFNFTTSVIVVSPNVPLNYTVTGSNGSCTAVAIVPISVNPSPTIGISTSTTNVICQGNSITLSANGAAGFTWQPSNTTGNPVVVSPTVTTLYTASGTNSIGCITTQSLAIIVNPVPNLVFASSLPFICAGNTTTLSIVNPLNTVSYNWNTGSTNSSIVVSPTITTLYSVTGTNTTTGCSATNYTNVAVYISTFVVTGPTALCNGSTAMLTAVGQATNYSWTSNSGVIGTTSSVTVAPTTNSTYYVTGSNGSCQDSQTVNIVVNPLPNVTASLGKKTICRYESATIVANGANSYSWNTGAITPSINITLTVTTTYTVTGTDLNGCSKTATVTQFVATCLGIGDLALNATSGLSIYPNPNNGSFTIISDVNVTLSIINSLGQVVDTITLTEDNDNKIKINNLPGGIYFIKGETNDLKLNTKIVIER